MNRRSSSYLAGVACALVLAACSPPPPPPDASTADASADRDAAPDVSQSDVAADRASDPDSTADAATSPDAPLDAESDAASVADAELDASSDSSADATVESGADAPADAASDALVDATADAAVSDGGSMALCARGVDAVIAVPAVGTSTTITTTLAATGLGGMNSGLSCSTGTFGGSERVFLLDVSARATVEITTSAALAGTDPALAIRRDCALSATEVACNDDDGGRNARVRAQIDPGRYYVLLDEYGPAASATGGDVTLTVRNVAVAPNAACATPTTLSRGVVVTESIQDGLDDSMSCRPSLNGPQHFYRYTIPAGQEASFSATPVLGSTVALVVRVYSDCASRAACLSDGVGVPTSPVVARIANSGASARDVIVSVGSTVGSAMGSYTIVADHAPVPATPANASCATPTPLPTTGVAVRGTTAGATEARDSFCGVSASGARAVYYSVTIPANQTLLASVAPTSAGFRPVIRGIRSCAAAACLFDSTVFGTTISSASYTNRTGADLSLLVAVQGRDDGERGDFELSGRLLSPSPNQTCATAIPLVVGSSLRDQAQETSTTLSSASCATTSNGPVLFYSLSVPAMSAMRVRATPVTPADPVLRVRAACGTAACEAFADSGVFGAPETVVVRNDTAAPRSYIVELSSASATNAGVFELSASPLVDAYTTTRLVAAACRTLPGTATNAGLVGDDVTLPTPLALPFTVRYFNENATHFSVNSNGMGQLFPSMSGTTSAEYLNTSLPGAADTGVVAVFWDDQRLDSMPMQSIRYATLGAAPNREFVVEYFASSFGVANSLRYQWVLFETSNVMEFHYCSMTGPMGDLLHTGESATIGLQSFDGSQGQAFSMNTANAIGGGSLESPNAIRWTPR